MLLDKWIDSCLTDTLLQIGLNKVYWGTRVIYLMYTQGRRMRLHDKVESFVLSLFQVIVTTMMLNLSVGDPNQNRIICHYDWEGRQPKKSFNIANVELECSP